MLTENRKRRRGCEGEGDQLNPQAKRSGGGPEGRPLVSEVGQDVWDSESSSSDTSSGISSPESAAGASTSLCAQLQKNHISQGSPASEDTSSTSLGSHGDSTSYDHINKVLREAHFSRLQIRGQPGSS